MDPQCIIQDRLTTKAIVIVIVASIITLSNCSQLTPSVTRVGSVEPEPENLKITNHDVNKPPVRPALIASLPSLLRYDLVPDVRIQCNSNSIMVSISTNQEFNGMIYPKGLSKNSTCMSEYSGDTRIVYTLPLRSCNTMSTDVDDGVEYFNTVMIQPHRRLVTNQGRGYHIRCRYQTKEKTITSSSSSNSSFASEGATGESQVKNQAGGTTVLDHQSMSGGSHIGSSQLGGDSNQLNVTLAASQPIVASAPIPTCTMRIFNANTNSGESVAENVKIGDKLQLVVSMDDQEVYGMVVTNCLVRDGLNWGEQPLINDDGCPIDEEIMPRFEYNANATRASVTFQAHKFPYTSSVYYQCNVRLCLRDAGGCDQLVPECNGSNLVRRKRFVDGGELDATAPAELLAPKSAQLKRDMSMEVFSGLHVDESEATSSSSGPDVTSGGPSGDFPTSTGDEESSDSDGGDKSAQQAEAEFCMSMRKFALAISLASLLLMLAVVLLAACVLHRRKMRNKQTAPHHHTAPYANRAYQRD